MAEETTDQPAAEPLTAAIAGGRPPADQPTGAGPKASDRHPPAPARGVPAPRPRGGSRTIQELDRIAAAEATRSRRP